MEQQHSFYALSVRKLLLNATITEKSSIVLRLSMLYDNGSPTKTSLDMFKVPVVWKQGATFDPPALNCRHENRSDYNKFRIFVEKSGLLSNTPIRTFVSPELNAEQFLQKADASAVYEIVASDGQGSITIHFSVNRHKKFQTQDLVSFSTILFLLTSFEKEYLARLGPGDYGSVTFREFPDLDGNRIGSADYSYKSMIKSSNSATSFCTIHKNDIDVINFVSSPYEEYSAVTVFFRVKMQPQSGFKEPVAIQPQSNQ